jgi:hypothetical protein
MVSPVLIIKEAFNTHPLGSQGMGFEVIPLRRDWVPTQVKCYSGYKGEEYPTSFLTRGKWHRVESILDRWYDADANYFKVVDEENMAFLLRWDLVKDQWAIKAIF